MKRNICRASPLKLETSIQAQLYKSRKLSANY